MKKLVLVLSFIFVYISAFSQNIQQGIVGCYAFSGNALDGSGNNHHAIVTSGTLSNDRNNNASSAYFFNNSYIEVPFAPFELSSYSYAMWVKILTNPTNGNKSVMLSVGGVGGDQNLDVSNNYGGLTGWVGGGYNIPSGTSSPSSNILPPVNTWFHLVSTRSNDVIKLYINGVLNSQVSTTALPYYGSSNKKAIIGGRSSLNPIFFFNGWIDDVVIYNRAITDVEVGLLYNSVCMPCSNQLGNTPSSINGASPVCVGQNNVNYSIPSVVNATGYTWTLPTNVTPSSGTNITTFPSITLNFGSNFTGGILKVKATNACQQGQEVEKIITVHPSTTPNFVGLNDSYCLNTPTFALSATPSGGIFTINSGTTTQFNASTLGVGNHIVRYAYIDGNGCLSTKEKTVVVHPLPTLSNNVNLSYGVNQIGFTIIGSPVGSTYTMNGTPITAPLEFIPSFWGVGTHTFVQSFTDANGCTNTLSKTISINEPLVLSNTSGATCWQNAVVNVDANMSVTGATTMTGAIVSFGAGYNSAQDRLIYPIPMFGVTGSFDVPTGVLKLIGTATTAQYQQILRSVQYHNISASPAYGTTRTINFTAGDVLPLYPCGSAVAHFYKFISAPAITWQNAKTAAEAQNYFGMKGYLATISCSQENNFAFNSIAKRGWIGASDDVAFTGVYSPNGEGQWYWVTGPEAGTRFWQGNQPGAPVGGFYNNWEVGEPNNYQNTNESFAHLLENGRWNDYVFNNNSILGYFIEFGGLPTDPVIQTTSSKQIQIATKPDFVVAGQICIDASPIMLTGSPTGGTFKINGSIATSLNPSDLGIGAHTVVYELAGCAIPTSKVVNVTPLPTVSISGLQASYCDDVVNVPLTGLPTGGTFRINGAVATQFSPSTAGAGNYTIKYTYTNGNGCTNSTTQEVSVVPSPTAQLTSLNDTYCVTQASFPLQGTPAGGTFKINAFDATAFDAQTLGAGIYTVTYTVTNGICNDTDQKIVEVVAPPVLSFDNVPNEYCSQAIPITLQASPAGGTLTINGVATNIFNPADYAVGDEVVVKYDYSVLAGCSSSLTKTIKVVFSSSFEQTSFDWEVCPSGTVGEPLEALSAGEEQALNALNGNLRYEWSNGETSRVIFITEQGTYKVLVKSESGCPLRDFTFNASIFCDTKFFIPSAFTPNGDGRNDKWEIFGSDVAKLDLRVYNRWGELVFVSNSMDNWWDGTVGGKPTPEGVYAWTVSYENPIKKGVVEKMQGRVTILR